MFVYSSKWGGYVGPDNRQHLQNDAVTAFGQHRLEATAPWGLIQERQTEEKVTPAYKKISPTDLAHFAMLSRGNCWLSVEGTPEPIPLTGGDCILLARGTSFVLRDGPRTRPESRSFSRRLGLLILLLIAFPLTCCDSIDRRAGNHEDDTKILDALDVELRFMPTETGQRFVKTHSCDAHDVWLRRVFFPELEQRRFTSAMASDFKPVRWLLAILGFAHGSLSGRT